MSCKGGGFHSGTSVSLKYARGDSWGGGARFPHLSVKYFYSPPSQHFSSTVGGSPGVRFMGYWFDNCWSVVRSPNSLAWPWRTSTIWPPPSASLSSPRSLGDSCLQSAGQVTYLVSSCLGSRCCLLLWHLLCVRLFRAYTALKGTNYTNPKGKKKGRADLVFWILEGRWLTPRGMRRADFWSGGRLVSWMPWKLPPWPRRRRVEAAA